MWGAGEKSCLIAIRAGDYFCPSEPSWRYDRRVAKFLKRPEAPLFHASVPLPAPPFAVSSAFTSELLLILQNLICRSASLKVFLDPLRSLILQPSVLSPFLLHTSNITCLVYLPVCIPLFRMEVSGQQEPCLSYLSIPSAQHGG